MYTLFLLRNQEFEETAALLNPDISNQSGLHVQSRPASVSSTGPPSAPPTLKTVDGGDDGSEQTNKSTSRGSRLLSSATPGLSRRKLFSYRQLSAWVSSSHDPPGWSPRLARSRWETVLMASMAIMIPLCLKVFATMRHECGWWTSLSQAFSAVLSLNNQKPQIFFLLCFSNDYFWMCSYSQLSST